MQRYHAKHIELFSAHDSKLNVFICEMYRAIRASGSVIRFDLSSKDSIAGSLSSLPIFPAWQEHDESTIG